MKNRSASIVHADNRDPRWLEFVARSQPSLFQEPDWASVMEETYGFAARVAMALENDAVVGGLPYSEIDDFRGRRRVAGAFADVCEPLGDPGVWPLIEAALCSDGMPWQIRSQLRPSELADEVREVGVLQTVKLAASSPEAFMQCDCKKRNTIRFGIHAGLTARRIDDVEVFYRLHSQTRKEKHGLLPQPREFFEAIARRYFPERGFVLVAERDSQLLAATLLLTCGDTLFVKFSASDRAALELKPNDFLFWQIIECAIHAGFRAVDMGISEAHGLARFKKGFGAASAPVFVGKYGLAGTKPAHVRVTEEALQKVTHVLTQPEVPLSAVQAGGDALYRFFV